MSITLEVLGGEDDGAKMVVLDEGAYLGRDGGAIPSHQQHLADGPVAAGQHEALSF